MRSVLLGGAGAHERRDRAEVVPGVHAAAAAPALAAACDPGVSSHWVSRSRSASRRSRSQPTTRRRARTTKARSRRSCGQIIFSFAIAIGFALMLFKVGPALLTSWLPIDGTTWFVVVEGLIRVAVFIACIALIGLIPDLKRVFQYRAAEHKAINALEAGAGSRRRTCKIQFDPPRCGTAFLLWVMVIGIIVFALVGHRRCRTSSGAASSCCR